MSIHFFVCRKPVETQDRIYHSQNGLYTARATVILEADKILLPTIFRCKVYIPEVNYTSIHEYVYNGNEPRKFIP